MEGFTMATETKLDNTQAENKENKNAENGSKEKNGSKASKTTSSGPIKRAVAGGIIGATIGYVSTPENRKSLLDRIDTDELKSKASDLGTKVKEKSKSSVASLKTSAGSLFKKDKDKSKDDEENVNSSSSETEDDNVQEYDELKEENQTLQDRLSQLEEKMNIKKKKKKRKKRKILTKKKKKKK